MGAPDKDFKYKWETTKVLLKNELLDGKNIVLHCRGGKGRAGTIAAILLIEFNYEKQEAIDFQTALKTIGRFTVKKQVGEDGVLFGTVTNGDVAEVVKEATKKDIDRRDISVPEIHGVGKYKVQIKLHNEVNAEINLEVTSY